MINRVVQTLWIGGRLTTMERMAIRSFLAHGHDVHLYCYDEVAGIPEGTIVKDGNDVLPRERIFVYADGFAKGSHAAFSNFFRYKLLLDRGGWWVDADVVCLRPFDFAEERMWAAERPDPPRELIVSTSVIKAPAGDPLMRWVWDACQQVDTSTVRFGAIGPRLLQAGVDALQLHGAMRPHTFFSPVPNFTWRQLIDRAAPALGTEVFGVHLWNQRWSAEGVDKDGVFPETCLYEQLKRRYLQP
jgi:hypothetical protein